MSTYHLLSWGANSHGQLGLGSKSEQCVLPREVNLAGCSLDPASVKRIAGGAGHTLLLDNSGRVYSCGRNDRGQTGHGCQEDVSSFREIEGELSGVSVVDVACGWDSSAALSGNGELFVWGSNGFGQLGQDPALIREVRAPLRVSAGRRIRRVSMGLRHTAAVDDRGELLVTGAGAKGQLGVARERDVVNRGDLHAFTKVLDLANVQDVSCGQHHTIAAIRGGQLYGFGDNKHGQLGVEPALAARLWTPARIAGVRFDSMVELRSGWTHVAVLNDGQVFAWGRNTYGQLGCERSKRPETWRPERIELADKIRQISLGSEHNIALTENGTILCWGWNEHGSCGSGNVRDVLFPEQVQIPSHTIASLIGTGAGHSFAVVTRNA